MAQRKHQTGFLWIVTACILAYFASPLASAQDLKLIPEPKQVERRAGSFTVTAGTQIVLGAAHAHEDRTAAEMLAEEIEAASGHKLRITTARALPRNSGVIYLGRVGDDRSLRAALAAKGLGIDEKFNEEGYVLDADTTRILVAGVTGQGLFYGVQTLRQLVRGEGKRLVCPAVSIRDWPTMRWRGLHDDISRGPIPTLDYMKKQVRTIAEYKLNLFSLYMEHVFDYQSQPLIAPKEGALTAAEIKGLVEYAKRYYVTILPEQQAFGHLHHVLKYEIYSDLAETPHGHVLAPVNEKSYDLIKSLYSELVPLFPGPLFHIGCDETFELGRGQTKARADEIGLGRVYLEHLRRVADIMKPHNKRLLFWHDIALRYPQLLDILPKDMIPVAWKYDPAPSYEEQVKPFKEAGFDFFVSPGANNWYHIYPDLEAAFVNTRNFVRDGQKFGALGMLNTTWDDSGEMLFGMNWPAVVFGAAASWQPGEASIDAFKEKYDWAFYRNDDHTFQEAIDNLTRAHTLLQGAGLEGALDDHFWIDPFSDGGARYTQKALPVARDIRLAAEHALESLYRHRARARAHQDTLDYLIFAARRLDLLGMKIQFTSEIGKFYWDSYLNLSDRERVRRNLHEITGTNARLEDLRDATTALRAAYSELWLKECRPYWLGNVLVRYDSLAGLFEGKILSVRAAQRQYREQAVLPTPQQMGFLLRPER